MVSEKRCRKCRMVKPASEFGLSDVNKDELRVYCMICTNEKSKEWRDQNADYFVNYKPQAQKNQAKYKEKHKELVQAQKLADYHATKNDPEKKAKRATYRDKNRQRIRDLNNRRNAETKAIVFSHYGNHCFCCGEMEMAFLTIDHSQNDGAAWRKAFASKMSGGRLYKVIIDLGFPEDLRLACWNCNSGRRHGVCPHDTERLRLVAA